MAHWHNNLFFYFFLSPKMYKKKYYKKKTYGKKRNYRRGVNAGTVKKIVNSAFNRRLETKFVSSEINQTMSNSATVFRYPSPGVGTTDADRVSDTVYLKSCYYSFTWTYDDTTNVCRFIIFQWLGDSSHDAPVTDSILESSFSAKVRAPYSMNNAQNYRILHNSIITLSENGSGAITKSGYITKFNTNKLVFTNTNAGAANIKRGQIYCLAVTDSSLSGPNFALAMKMNYTDA